MQPVSLPAGKMLEEAFKTSCRFLCRPLLRVLPDTVANRFPFLGRVCVHGPQNLRLRFTTHGSHGKDRIACKLARHGFWSYEGDTTRTFLALVRQARIVLDIGANTGLFALAAAQANKDCRVWAFEPVPFIFEMLQSNIRLNQLVNVIAVPVAVSDFVGEIPFYITRTALGIPTDSSAQSGFRPDVEEFKLPATTLDHYVQTHAVPPPDIVKIDAEATELQVLFGAAQTLRKHRPYVICEILPDLDHAEMQRFLEPFGYLTFSMSDSGLQRRSHLEGIPGKGHRNYLFAPAEKEQQLLKVCRREGIAVC